MCSLPCRPATGRVCTTALQSPVWFAHLRSFERQSVVVKIHPVALTKDHLLHGSLIGQLLEDHATSGPSHLALNDAVR